MPLYLFRPVFDFDVNWATVPKKSFSYDLRPLQLAYAAPRFERTQTATVQGIEFDLTLRSEAEIVAWEDFTATVKGRLGGFWMPSPFHFAQIEAGIDGDHFIVRDQNLRGWWDSHPSKRLIFEKDGETTQYKALADEDAVTVTADGREKVELSGVLSPAVDETWTVRKLLYVRLLDDDEEAAMLGENLQQRTIKVIELPNEYQSIETAQTPVYLYDFFMQIGGSTKHWRLTGLNQDITSSAETFATYPIEHSDLTLSTRSDVQELSIQSWFGEANPMSLLVPNVSESPLWVTVHETTYAVPDTRATIFTGKCKVSSDGKKLTAKCVSLLDAIGRRFPRFYIQSRCNHFVYDPHCKAVLIQVGGNITEMSLRWMKLDLTIQHSTHPEINVENYFALGWAEFGSDENKQTRSIRQSSVMSLFATGPDKYQMTFRIDRPWVGVEVGNLIQVFPGCDGSRQVCNLKFRNLRNYGGHDYVPSTNPAVRAMKADNSTGNKK